MAKIGTETEAKFYVTHLGSIRQRVLQKGGRPILARQLERNWRFDDSEGTLKERGIVLRLREDDKIRLTYKRKVNSIEQREEIEFIVEDAAAARAFLNALGFRVVSGYEKYRETFMLNTAEVLLDELPFGFFVEVEGSSLADIQGTAEQLSLSWDKRVRASYLDLMNTLELKLDLTFSEATFRNYESLRPIDPDLMQVESAWRGNENST